MNVLIIMAHPDDEVIFGWPLMQSKVLAANVALLTLSHNQTKYGNGPTEALREVCEHCHVKLVEANRVETNFYRIPPRYADVTLRIVLNEFYTAIQYALDLIKPDAVFTHNPMGEYGHGDHRLVFNAVSLFPVSLMLTDICFQNASHLSSDAVPDIYSKFLYGYAGGKRCELDLAWYERMKRIYDKHNAWSWGGHDAITECTVYYF